MRFGLVIGGLMAVSLAGCGSAGLFTPKAAPDTVAPATAEQTRPAARPATTAARPPSGARTVAEFDTVSAAEKQAATAKPADPAGETRLGETVVSLGDPSKPGLWLETPLVSSAQKGRVAYNGKSAKLDLIPIAGAATAGSRMSLSAMQLIGAPLTDLPTVEVFSGS